MPARQLVGHGHDKVDVNPDGAVEADGMVMVGVRSGSPLDLEMGDLSMSVRAHDTGQVRHEDELGQIEERRWEVDCGRTWI